MSLAEIEMQVLKLSEEERRQFATWFYQNEGKILPPSSDTGDDATPLSPEVMTELLRRRQELEEGAAKIISLEELDAGMAEAVNEVRRSRH